MSNGNYLYDEVQEGENQTTLKIVDATDLNKLQPVDDISIALDGYFFERVEDNFYFFTYDHEFWIIGKQDGIYVETKLQKMLRYPTFSSVHVEDSFLYIFENWSDAGSYRGGVDVFDISDIKRIRELIGVTVVMQ